MKYKTSTKDTIQDLILNKAVPITEMTSLITCVNAYDEDFSIQEIKAQKKINIKRDQPGNKMCRL